MPTLLISQDHVEYAAANVWQRSDTLRAIATYLGENSHSMVVAIRSDTLKWVIAFCDTFPDPIPVTMGTPLPDKVKNFFNHLEHPLKLDLMTAALYLGIPDLKNAITHAIATTTTGAVNDFPEPPTRTLRSHTKKKTNQPKKKYPHKPAPCRSLKYQLFTMANVWQPARTVWRIINTRCRRRTGVRGANERAIFASRSIFWRWSTRW